MPTNTMKYFEVGVWRTEFGYYRIRAKNRAEAERIADEWLERGEEMDGVRDADMGIGYVNESRRGHALRQFFEKVDVPQ